MQKEDHQVQVIYFGGRYFIEGMFSFGGMNSPAIYNLPALYLIIFGTYGLKSFIVYME